MVRCKRYLYHLQFVFNLNTTFWDKNTDSITFICFLLGFFAVEIILVIIHITSISTAVKVLYFFIFKQPFRINVVIYIF
jgi:hypothetical protein